MSTTEQLSLGPIIGYWLSCCTFAGPACVRLHLCSKETRKWFDYSLRYVKRCLLTHLMAVQFYVPLILYDPCWIKAVRWHFKPLRSLAKTLKIAIECGGSCFSTLKSAEVRRCSQYTLDKNCREKQLKSTEMCSNLLLTYMYQGKLKMTTATCSGRIPNAMHVGYC